MWVVVSLTMVRFSNRDLTNKHGDEGWIWKNIREATECWLVLWNFFIFPYIYIYTYIYIGNNTHNWLSYFSRWLKPPTRNDQWSTLHIFESMNVSAMRWKTMLLWDDDIQLPIRHWLLSGTRERVLPGRYCGKCQTLRLQHSPARDNKGQLYFEWPSRCSLPTGW